MSTHSVTFEIHSLVDFHLEITRYPELTSTHKWVQKGIEVLKKHTPKILQYLSKQKILSHLSECNITIETIKAYEPHHITYAFQQWIKKEKKKRLVYIICEGSIIPLTPILALLPGPNIFFYIPALFLYYHVISFLGLRKVDIHKLDIQIRHVDHFDA